MLLGNSKTGSTVLHPIVEIEDASTLPESIGLPFLGATFHLLSSAGFGDLINVIE